VAVLQTANSGAWIGGRRLGTAQDADFFPGPSYRDWCPGEPDNDGGGQNSVFLARGCVRNGTKAALMDASPASTYMPACSRDNACCKQPEAVPPVHAALLCSAACRIREWQHCCSG
jgi:hypothetical protein